jgi:ABC-type glutathione transport system ATPase component
VSALLEVRNLRTHFAIEGGEFPAVDGVSFALEAGRTLGIVGESGCGKSVTALSIMGLVPQPPGRIAGGEEDSLLDLRFQRHVCGGDLGTKGRPLVSSQSWHVMPVEPRIPMVAVLVPIL